MTLSRLALRVLVTGVLVSAPALFTASVTSESPCEALARWAEPYRGMSPSLDDMVRLDRARQIAVFNVLSPTVRAALWQEHLQRFARRVDLSDAQRALVAEGVAVATPALYERQPAAVQAFEELWPRIDSAFGGEHMRAWFDLGTAHIQALSVWEQIAGIVTARAQSPRCECGVQWDDCPWGHCWLGGCNVIAGCGPMGWYGCDGMCR